MVLDNTAKYEIFLKSFSAGVLFSIDLLICCNDDDPSITCNEQAIISDSQLDSARRDALVINSLSIVDDCLIVNMSAGGCDGDSWEVRLIGSELILESLPPQRPMLLLLKNDEACEVFITREYTFDITPTQDSIPSIWLNFIDTDQRILYEYD